MPPMAARAYRSLWRDPEHGLVAGVCAGLAERLGVDPLLLRAVFVATTAAGGVGVVAYGVLWLLLPAVGEDRAPLRGLRRRRPGSWRTAAGVALLTLSGLLVLRQLGLWFSDAIVWPVVLAAAGVALAWRLSGPRADQTLEESSTADAGAPAATERRRALQGAYRGGFGVALIVGAALLFLYANGLLAGLGDLALTVLVVVAAVGLILAPFWWRLVRSLTAERAARIRSQERTEVAAHLHDSVLQTLALVQRQAGDPRAVSALARRQERELRAWLQNRLRSTTTRARLPPPPGRRSSTPPSSRATPARCRSTPRPMPNGSRSSYATAARGSTPIRRRRTGAECATPSSAAWPGTAGARRSARPRAAAPRSS